MPEEKGVSPVAVIGGGLVLGLAAAAGLFALAQAAPPTPPPEEFICPHCGAAFATYEELATHIQAVHPPEGPEPQA